MPALNVRESYKFEQNRLNSFGNWPQSAPVDGRKLAEAGFYYSGKDFEVVCYECNGHIAEWSAETNPLIKHKDMFPGCKFVKGESDNVPISGQALSPDLNDFPRYDVNERIGDILRRDNSNTSENSSTTQLTLDNFPAILAQRQNELLRDPEIAEFRRLMKSERNRLRTFYRQRGPTWPHDFIAPEEIARAGFYFRAEQQGDDRVQCVYCLGVVYSFERGDRALQEHARHYPRCPFILGENVGNIPIHEDPILGPQRHIPARGRDVCGNYVPVDLNTQFQNSRQQLSTSANSPRLNNSNQYFNQSSHSAPALSIVEYGISPHRGPKHLDKRTIETRLATFEHPNWNKNISASSLANAGLFYIGMGDYVKCFSCDNDICYWKEEDDPWFRHAIASPGCEFLRITKGESFISNCFKEMEISEKIAKRDKMVALWWESADVQRLINLSIFSEKVIRCTLGLRWDRIEAPFDSFDTLYYACLDYKPAPKNEPSSTESTLPNSSISTASSTTSSSSNLLVPENALDSNSSVEAMEASSSSSQSSESLSDDEFSSLSPMSSSPSTSPPSSSPLSNRDKSLESENRLLCKVCLDREVRFVFLPCGHLSCSQCAPALVECPICRKKILGNVRIFL